MSDEKSSPIGIIIIVVAAAIITGCASGKSAGENKPAKSQETVKPTTPEKPAEPPKPKYDFTKGLVAYYPFNGNAKDESGNGHDGTLINGGKLTSDRLGEAEKALSVPRKTSLARVPYHEDLALADKITLSAWIKPPHLEQDTIKADGLGIIDTGASIDHYGGYYMRIQKDHKMWIVISAGANKFTFLVSQAEFGKGEQWVHVVFSYDNNEIMFYVDGKKDAAKNVGAGFLKGRNQAAPLTIGHQTASSLLGEIDDVRIYNRALSEGQVKALYEFEKPKE